MGKKIGSKEDLYNEKAMLYFVVIKDTDEVEEKTPSFDDLLLAFEDYMKKLKSP